MRRFDVQVTATAVLALLTLLALPSAQAQGELEPALRRAVMLKDLVKAEEVLGEMHRIGGSKRMETVLVCLRAIPEGEDVLYWLLVRGATGFGDRAALLNLGEFIVKHRGDSLSRDLMFGLQGNHAWGAVEIHGMVLEKGAPDLARMAAEQLAEVPEVASVDALVNGFKHQTSSGVRKAIARALQLITGKTFGTDAELWRSWWAGAKERGVTAAGGEVRDQGEGAYRESEREILTSSGKVLVLTLVCEAQPSFGGVFDHIEYIVEGASIPCDVMDKNKFEDNPPPLDQYMAIALNCTQIRPHCECPTCKPGTGKTWRMYPCTGCDKHSSRAHKLGSKGVEIIRSYVQRGGYLFTEDWGLIELLEPAWPKIVGSWPRLAEDRTTGKMLGIEKFLKEQDVDVNPVRGVTSHPLLRGVYPFHHETYHGSAVGGDVDEGTRVFSPADRVGALSHQWHIDDESPIVEVRNKSAVTVLLASQAVRQQGEGRDACALTFFPGASGKGQRASVITDGDGSDVGFGSGRVVHILSHFGKQNDISDEAAIRNLLLNFLREAAEAYCARKERAQR